MCECLEYEDGSACLCVPCAQMWREAEELRPKWEELREAVEELFEDTPDNVLFAPWGPSASRLNRIMAALQALPKPLTEDEAREAME